MPAVPRERASRHGLGGVIRNAGARLAWLLLGLLSALATEAWAGDRFVAFSLKAAAQRLTAERPGPELTEAKAMAGITRVAGMVYDPGMQDIVVVGQARPSDPPLALDDMVVALRAVVVHKRWPLVSIDEAADTGTTHLQSVRFEGGIARTGFGKALYEADVLLKDLVLGRRSAAVWGVKSYLALSEAELRRSGGRGLSSVRFWYVTDGSRMTARGNVFAIDELRIALRTESQPAEAAAGSPPAHASADSAGELFARDFSKSFGDLAVAYQPLARLLQLSALTALAGGMDALPGAAAQLDYWLRQHVPDAVETATRHPLITARVDVPRNGKVIDLQISGGVQLSATVRRLKDGDVSALEEAVLQSRPSAAALSWRVPLEGWRLAGYADAPAADGGNAAQSPPGLGTTVLKAIGLPPAVLAAPAALRPPAAAPMPSPVPAPLQPTRPAAPVPAPLAPIPSVSARVLPPSPLPVFQTSPTFTRQHEVPRVGGVMLSGEAAVMEGGRPATKAAVFSLLAAGEGAGLTPLAQRRFATALWSVYYSDEDPGISIDPIAWGADRQLVRYIGRVLNTDLGRVMREADYTMKKWAVGTERPDIPGFKDVDTLGGPKGMTLTDAFRRFWFVPERMRFQATDNALVFESGQMRLRTESNLYGRRTPPIPSDEAFAGFFSTNYGPIAARYPIFDDLLDYARHVALAKYLKNQGLPLQWYLLAHHDQVLTELSAGSVETLSKGSRFAQDVRIEGGVDLAARYVLDKSTAEALRRAMAAATPEAARAGAAPAPISHAAPASFHHEQRAFSIVPQHSQAGGKDRFGNRFQTDIAVRDQGRPGLELVRYFRPGGVAERTGAEMGRGWRLLVPLRAEPMGPADQPFNTLLVPRQWRIRNALGGEDEILTLDTRVYTLSGYRPADLQQSRFVGMFWTAGGLLRLGDKFGNEFWFDATGLLREMHFSKDYGVRFDYEPLDVPADPRRAPSLRLTPEGRETDDRFNVKLPRRLRLFDAARGTQEIYVLGERNGLVAYLPEGGGTGPRRVISLRRDGSHVLEDADGNEAWFDLRLRLQRQRVRVIAGMAQGRYEPNRDKTDLVFVDRHRVRFEHGFDGAMPRVERALLYQPGKAEPLRTVHYRYDEDGMLAEALAGPRP